MLIVFDLDGTLVDSVADIAASANELVTSLGGRPIALSAVTMMVGDGAGMLVKRALGEGGVDPETPHALSRFLEIYDRRLLDQTMPYAGMRETLALLARRSRMAILTNKPQAHSERVLEGLGLREFFDEVMGGDGGAGKKPDPSGLLSLTASEPGGRAVLVGDSPIDDETARAAGCPFIWARYGFGAKRFGRDCPATPYVLDSPRDLVAVIDRLIAVMRGL